MKFKKAISIFVSGFILAAFPIFTQAQDSPVKAEKPAENETEILAIMHTISSHTLFGYVEELCAEKYGGRLTGAPCYNASAQWLVDHLKEWGLQPGGDNGTYFQDFPNPYTLVLPGSEVTLHIPYKNRSEILKHYTYETDFIPGSTSDSGEVTAEVVYVGYGITAPGLGFDEYKGLDVTGKIVLIERETPISAEKEPEEFKKWRSYSFHQYKVTNASQHGAAGMLYNYHVANPNCLFIKGLVLTYVGQSIVDDIFMGSGRVHRETKEKIDKERIPQSFNTQKRVTLKNFTRHHPEGIGRNVIAQIPGSDSLLKDEVIVIGAHLDHTGCNHEIMPGADDNASGVAVAMGAAQALAKLSQKPARTIVFTFFGAEEQGVKGSEFYLASPLFNRGKTIAYINLDGVGRGMKLTAAAGLNYPELWQYFADVNQRYIHREVIPTQFHNRARPRLDAAHFMWAGVPSISFSASGAEVLPFSTYHRAADRPGIITPEIMEDLARLIFLAVADPFGL